MSRGGFNLGGTHGNPPASFAGGNFQPSFAPNGVYDDPSAFNGLKYSEKGAGLIPSSSLAGEIEKSPFLGMQTKEDHVGLLGERRVNETNFITVEKGQTGTSLLRRTIIIYSMFPGVDGARLIYQVFSPFLIDWNTIEVYIEEIKTKTVQPQLVTEFGSGFGPSVSINRIAFAPYEISFATNFSETAFKYTENAAMWNNILLMAIAESYRDYLLCYAFMLVASTYTTPKFRNASTYGNQEQTYESNIMLERNAVGCFDRARNPLPEIAGMLDNVLTANQMGGVDTMIAPVELKTHWLAKMGQDAFFTSGKTLEENRRDAFSTMRAPKFNIPPENIFFVCTKADPVGGETLLAQNFQMFLMATERLTEEDTFTGFTTLCIPQDALLPTSTTELIEAASVYFTEKGPDGKHYLHPTNSDTLKHCNLMDSNGSTKTSPFYTDFEGKLKSVTVNAEISEEFNPIRHLIARIHKYLTVIKKCNIPRWRRATVTTQADSFPFLDGTNTANADYMKLESVFNQWMDGFGLSDLLHSTGLYARTGAYGGALIGPFFDLCVGLEYAPIRHGDDSQVDADVPQPTARGAAPPPPPGGGRGATPPPAPRGKKPTRSRDSRYVAGKYDQLDWSNPLSLRQMLNLDGAGQDAHDNELVTLIDIMNEWENDNFNNSYRKGMLGYFALLGFPSEATAKYATLLDSIETQRDLGGPDNRPPLAPAAHTNATAFQMVPLDKLFDAETQRTGNFFDFSIIGNEDTNVAADKRYKQFMGDRRLSLAPMLMRIYRLDDKSRIKQSELAGLLSKFRLLDGRTENPILLGFAALWMLAGLSHENLLFMCQENIPLPFSLGRMTQVCATGLSIYFLASRGQSVQLMFSEPESRYVTQSGVFQFKFITRAKVGGVRIPDGPVFGYPLAKIYKLRSTDAPHPMKHIDFEFGNRPNLPGRDSRGFITVFLPKNNTLDAKGTEFGLFNSYKSYNNDQAPIEYPTTFYASQLIWDALQSSEGSGLSDAMREKYSVFPHIQPQEIGNRPPTINSFTVYLDNCEVRFMDSQGKADYRVNDKLNPFWPGYFGTGAIRALLGSDIGSVQGGPAFAYNTQRPF